MTSVKKTLVLACAVSLLGFGAAYAQTDPNAAPAATAPAAAAPDASTDATAKPMKKKMHKKHASKKAAEKKTM